MLARTLALLMAALLAAALVGCAAPAEKPEDAGAPPAGAPAGDAAGSKLAPGLYELEDGTAQVLGTLEYSDLEGGFWLISDGTAAAGSEGKTLAVIANADAFKTQLEELKGQQVFGYGTMVDGASIRMAGPEIELTKIEAVSDTVDPAE